MISRTLHEDFLTLHNEGSKLFDNFIEISGIKKIVTKILDLLIKK